MFFFFSFGDINKILRFSPNRWRVISNRERWHILNFGDFLDVDNGLLDRNFRSFKNEFDKIHLGYRGISLLTSLVRSGITKAIEGTSSCAPVQSASKLRDYY